MRYKLFFLLSAKQKKFEFLRKKFDRQKNDELFLAISIYFIARFSFVFINF